MGKASEITQYLAAHPLTDEEVAARGPKVPELRLKPDATVVVDDRTPAQGLLGRLSGGSDVRSLHVIGTNGNEAVIVPVDRYVQLVGLSLLATGARQVGPDNQLVPADLAAADVEPVDPHADWA